MKALQLQDLIDFLLKQNWRITDEKGRFTIYKPPKELGLPHAYFLELPKDDLKPGWNRYAAGIVEILADIYNEQIENFQIKLEQANKSFFTNPKVN